MTFSDAMRCDAMINDVAICFPFIAVSEANMQSIVMQIENKRKLIVVLIFDVYTYNMLNISRFIHFDINVFACN